ncbi:MAG: hypothetical protein QW102_03505 [Candidatus Nezhaarchaeales archaeon]
MNRRDEGELSRGITAAKRIATTANILYKTRMIPKSTTSESIDSALIEILLKLVKARGRAPLSSLVVGDLYKTLVLLQDLKRINVIKILETPFRTYVILTEYGWKRFNEIVNILT